VITSFSRESKIVGQLSVIIPIGAMRGKLDNFIKTIESTTSKTVEFIVVIDDKKDGTAEEVREFLASKKKEFEFLILQQEFNGPGPARNAGLKVARNPWIIFCDSDDVLWVDRVCEELHGVKSSDEFMIGNYSVRSNNHTHYSHSSNLASVALNPGIWRIAIKRSRVLQVEFPHLLLAEDQIFLIYCGLFKSKPIFSKQIFYIYHLGVAGQLSSKSKNGEHLVSALKEISRYSKNLGNFSRENFYLGIISARLTTTYLKMRRKQIKKLPKNIYFMKISGLLGFALGLFLIIVTSAKSQERE
jgi:glycosyltransferase involved in cell wall biosynthesis